MGGWIEERASSPPVARSQMNECRYTNHPPTHPPTHLPLVGVEMEELEKETERLMEGPRPSSSSPPPPPLPPPPLTPLLLPGREGGKAGGGGWTTTRRLLEVLLVGGWVGGWEGGKGGKAAAEWLDHHTEALRGRVAVALGGWVGGWGLDGWIEA